MTSWTEVAIGLSRSSELLILAKATLALGAGLAAAGVARRAPASVRHLLLSTTFGAVLLLPLLPAVAPAVMIGLPVPAVSRAAAPPTAVGAPATPRGKDAHGVAVPAGGGLLAWSTLARTAWATGAALLLASFGVGLWRLHRVRRFGLPWTEGATLARTLAAAAGVRRPVDVVLSEQVAAPLTCGVRRPAIVLPPDAAHWGDADLRRALVHELEHVRRGDWLVQLAARAVCTVYWFHPLVWACWRKLCLEAERACDDAVALEAERTEYAEQLVLLARRLSAGSAAHPALAMASRSDLSARVSALLDPSQRRGAVGGLPVAAAVTAALALAIAMGPVRLVAAFERPSDAASGPGRRAVVRALDRALYEAAEEGDLPQVIELLDGGADVNAKVSGDGSPLIGAARGGHLEVARLLLDRGADPDLPVPGDGNPLIMAAREGHADVVELLLDRGAGIDRMVPDDENALIQASGAGQVDVVRLLVRRGADVNARVFVEPAFERPRGEWRTPLFMARKGGHAEVVRILIAAGARDETPAK